MKTTLSKKNAVLGLTAACAAALLWMQHHTGATQVGQNAAADTAIGGAGQRAGIASAMHPVAFVEPTPQTPAQAKLGIGQLLQLVQSLPAELRSPTLSVNRLAQAAAVDAQIAAMDRAGIPEEYRDGERIRVNVGLSLDYASVRDPQRLARAAADLVGVLRGAGVEAHAVNGSPMLEVLVPAARLEWVAAQAGVSQVGLMRMPDVVATFTNGATASGIDQLRSLGNYTGVPEALRKSLQGEDLTIAIMDRFDDTEGEVAKLQKKGEWPSNTDAQPDKLVMVPVPGQTFGYKDVDHGMAVTEIVYDIAPKAKFRLYDTIGSKDWIGGVQDAANLDEQNRPLGAPRAQVITASLVGQGSSPGDGTGGGGPFQGLYDAIEAASRNGVIVVNGAGNHAMAHWDGDSDGASAANVYQDFDPATAGVQNTNIFSAKLKPGDASSQCSPVGKNAASLTLTLDWNDWASADNTVDTDYKLELVYWRDEVKVTTTDPVTRRSVTTTTPAGWEVAAQSDNLQDGAAGQWPLESVVYAPPAETSSKRCGSGKGVFAARVLRKTPGAANFLRVFTKKVPMQYAQAERSVMVPADSPYVITVAALDVADSALEDYSSRGPVLAAGGSRPGGQAEGNGKPDMASFAQVKVSAGSFSGTSAATPHVAALALLGLQHHRQLTAATEPAALAADATEEQKAERGSLLTQRRSDLAEATRDTLVQVAGTQGNDLGAAGLDGSYGYGRLKFHAQSQACFLSALYVPAYRALLPQQASPLAEGEKSYDELQTSNASTCSTVATTQ